MVRTGMVVLALVLTRTLSPEEALAGFASEPVIDWDSASRCDTARFGRYFWGMLNRGVYLPCSQFEANFVSTAHTAADIDHTIAATREAMAVIAASR